jgi:hypothetical protein
MCTAAYLINSLNKWLKEVEKLIVIQLVKKFYYHVPKNTPLAFVLNHQIKKMYIEVLIYMVWKTVSLLV